MPDSGAGWLLLIAQLPPKPDYLRVKLRRRVQRIGAVALRGAVYVLPNQPEAAEDFEWLRTELLADGADAIICSAAPVAGITEEDLRKRFRDARGSDYQALAEDARALAKTDSRDDVERALPRLRRRLDEIGRVDFFGSMERFEAEGTIEGLATMAASAPGRAGTDRVVRDTTGGTPRGRTWVTREGVFVDRIASAWLIRRFIDPEATFKFVAARGYQPQGDEVRFDMYEAEYTHEGDRCTFETLLARFGVDDPALHVLGEIVHDIDCKDAKYERPEAAGVESILRGLVNAHAADSDRMTQGSAILEALYSQLGGATH
ncbi:MAG TPA: chromate resistance protein ChrB domain-containing protein [Gemmatimonadaceae bacterium]|nr:chromate resistance protein ChrB domain-containing protein [Gemmatimonadaceae bacterium]